MARNTELMPSFSNVRAGDTATLAFPLGKTYDSLHIPYAGVTLAQLKNPRIEVNGQPLMSWRDGMVIDSLNKRLGHNVEDGILDIHFKRSELKTLMEQRMFGLGTASYAPDGTPYPSPISGVNLLVDIDQAATNPVLTATALKSNAAPIGTVTKVRSFPVSINPGDNTIDNITRNDTASIAAIHLFTSATIEEMAVYMDQVRTFFGKTSIIEKIQRDHGRAPQAGCYSADFVLDGDMLQALTLKGLQDFRFNFKAADATPAATAGMVYVEYFDNWLGI